MSLGLVVTEGRCLRFQRRGLLICHYFWRARGCQPLVLVPWNASPRLLSDGLANQKKSLPFPVVDVSLSTQPRGSITLSLRPERTLKAYLAPSEQSVEPTSKHKQSHAKSNVTDSNKTVKKIRHNSLFNAGRTPCRHGVYSLS